MMLDFICELEVVLGKWPEGDAWSLAQIADQTHTSVPQVVDFLSEILDRELEVHESLSRAEAVQAFTVLSERMADELAARQRHIELRRDKAVKAYDVAMEKVRVLLVAKNWRSAYKSLTYYVGCYEKDVPKDLLLNLCGECLRLGVKSGANLQELSQWLRKGIAACLLGEGSSAAVEDALDFLDAYGECFMDSSDDRGRRLIANVLASVKGHAEAHDLVSRFDTLRQDLRIA